MGCLNKYLIYTKVEILVRLFPYGKTIAGLKQVCDQGHLFTDSTAARARRITRRIIPGDDGGARWWRLSQLLSGGDPCSLFQTQAAQTVVQSREGPATPRMAFLLGLVGIGMSGYSSRQLTLHYKPSNHLFR